mgnify:CR=1 FL=1
MNKYGMRLRGFSIGCQPMNGLIKREDDTSGEYHDILVYDRELTEKELVEYELDDLNKNKKYLLITPDGDHWEYDNKEDARSTQYIFGGTVLERWVDDENDSNK